MRILASPAASDVNGNPYVELLYAALRVRGVVVDPLDGRRLLTRPDVAHVHWPERLVRGDRVSTLVLDAVKMLALLAVARRRGTALVWTAHNLAPHDAGRRRLMQLYMWGFARQVDLIIGLTDGSRAPLQERYRPLRRTPFVVVPHGHYRDAYPADRPTRGESRSELGLDADRRTLLTLGYVRRYKNIAPYVGAFVRDAGTDAQLAIVGRPATPELADEIRTAAAGDRRVELRLAEASPDELVAWHVAADVIVLPYSTSSSLNSGAALLALSLDRPVVMPDGPAARELRDQVGGDWVIPVRGGAHDFLSAALLAPLPKEERPPLDDLSWERIAEQTEAAYERASRPGA